ncbi:hypothetical protein PIB30_074295 [Stylosanthes scabra]|uniref:Uncharacterized protein n=1 Tax=Stylosanthes scabra TaxID=79078 RepID=A0ABU6UP06_9FABA|nr:hypothetical protein [Stylosanthes scabra]
MAKELRMILPCLRTSKDSEQPSTPGTNPPRPGTRIAHSEPTISDPRLGVLLHVELSKQPRLGVSNTRLGVPSSSLMESSSFQRPRVQPVTPSVPCSASLDSKQRLGA